MKFTFVSLGKVGYTLFLSYLGSLHFVSVSLKNVRRMYSRRQIPRFSAENIVYGVWVNLVFFFTVFIKELHVCTYRRGRPSCSIRYFLKIGTALESLEDVIRPAFFPPFLQRETVSVASC